jgi:outer membrane protein assembly factor BamA
MPAIFSLLILAAQLSVSSPVTSQTVLDVVIQGPKRTREYVIRNEIDTRRGDTYDPARWAADVQRVKDLGLFWTTETTAATRPEGLILYLTVVDKWTLIPEFSFDRTQDATEFAVGLYEANVLGTGKELGFKFARRQRGNTFSVSADADRIGRTPYFTAMEAREANSKHIVYDQTSGAGEATVGYYEYQRTSFYAQLGRRLDRDGEQTVAVFYYTRLNRYQLTDDAEERAISDENGFRAPPFRISHRFGFTAASGKIHYDDYIYRGSRLTTYVLSSVQTIGTPRRFERLSADWKLFGEPLPRHNAGLRLLAGTGGSSEFEDMFTMGGVSEVRGFPDERFYGQHIWVANAEYRFPAMDNKWVLGQLVGFVDAGRTWTEGGPFDRNVAVSTGAGIRLVAKPIIATGIRLDFAQTLNPYRRQGYSLGVHQYF